MKKKIVSILLSVGVMTMALTGCGILGNAANIEADFGMVSGEDTMTEQESAAVVADVDENVDWTTAYDNYFEENSMLRDNAKLETTLDVEGLEMTFIAARSGDSTYMGIDMGKGAFELYETNDMKYLRTISMGMEKWSCTPSDGTSSSSDIDSIKPVSVEDEDINSYTYREEVTINGVVYDVLDIVVNGDEEGETEVMSCYINRATQLVDKYVFEMDGAEYEMYIESIQGISIPDKAIDAEEVTEEELTEAMVGVIVYASIAYGLESAQQE